MSSFIQRCKSASLHRSEQKGITADWGSGTKGLSHVGQRTFLLLGFIILENTRISQSSKRPITLERDGIAVRETKDRRWAHRASIRLARQSRWG
ncbi:hypothetical protein VN12_11070 [Pirellula sp. SH-Sr6A]|nr:hypothetical protein VN12_11070 [Pirellula sp. SH-Sr6A]